MPKPKIDSLYAVYPSQLNSRFAEPGKDKIPVRVLSASEWTIPKSGVSLQPHQAVPSARFVRPTHTDRDWSACFGLLVCWAQEPSQTGDTGLRAATGEEAVKRLRALDRPNLRKYQDYLYGDLKDAHMQVDVIFADDLTDLITADQHDRVDGPDEGAAVSQPKIIDPIPPTRPRYSHHEAELLMGIILQSGVPLAEHLVGKLVTGATGRPDVYAKALARVRTSIILNTDGHTEGPIAPGTLQKLVMVQFPNADRFELIGRSVAQGGPGAGLTFSLGTKRWHFAAPDGYISPEPLDTRGDAGDAYFNYYVKPSERP